MDPEPRRRPRPHRTEDKGPIMRRQITAGIALLLLTGTASAARWHVEITNVTPGQTFTPILAATHYGNVRFFTPGDPASNELSLLAEAGDIGPLTAVLESHGDAVGDIESTGGLLGPGQSVELTISGRPGQRLSVAAMLIPTNDTFFAVNAEFLPIRGTKTVEALAWDAGSEANDQNCLNIPGPRCGGTAASPPAASDEGFVHVSNSFHELGDADAGEVLSPAEYAWNNPVALVRIRRIW
jgi:hypothetical protein